MSFLLFLNRILDCLMVWDFNIIECINKLYELLEIGISIIV